MSESDPPESPAEPDETSRGNTAAVNRLGDAASKPRGASSPERAYDRELIARAAGGDARAFRELVERHKRKAHAVAYGIVRNKDDAHEVVQDAFMRVYRHLDDFEGQASFSTWLYRIVFNLSIDALRRRSPGRAVELDDRTDLEGAPDEMVPWRGGGDPFAALDQRRLGEAVQECLDKLPPYHRTVIVLRELEGLSYEEIAQTMQISKGTVMSRLFHARRKMQRMLRERFGDEVPLTADERDALADGKGEEDVP